MTRTGNYLEYSTNEGKTKQKLLFEETNFVYPLLKGQYKVPADFYTNGYSIIDNVNSAEEAKKILEIFTANIDINHLPIYSQFLSKLQIAKIDRIPVCSDLVKTSFQALHFDMGLPIVSDSTQTTYLIIALYCTKEATSINAKTRLVNIRELMSQKDWGNVDDINKRLINYVENYGDGWLKPSPINTFRLSCFARVVDAITGNFELAKLIDKTTGDWFQYDLVQEESIGLKNEYEFYKKYGLDLEKVEKQICLAPGQLLIFDNLRIVHGRIGKRQPQEIYQFMLGVKSATVKDIDAIREFIISQIVCSG